MEFLCDILRQKQRRFVMKKKFLVLACAAALCSACDESSSSIPAVTDFDIDRYMGQWYEIARLPNNFEKNMTHVSTIYTAEPDGMVHVKNQGYRNGEAVSIEGTGRFKDSSGTGELEVTFFWPFYSPYRIIHLDQEYTTSVVTGSSKSYLWILSRTPELSLETENDIMEFLTNNGYPVEELIYSWDDNDSDN
jgi:apolipoprotein D and lipocalin family protein